MHKLAVTVVLAGLWLPAAVDSAEPVTNGRSGWFDFALYTSGLPIGRHRITYRRDGDVLTLTYDTDVSFSFAFIQLAKFKQSMRQTWRGGRLQSLDSRTEDDGKVTEVRARATAQGLAIEGPFGSFVAPADTVPTFYWDPGMIGPARILDVEKGKLINVTFEREGQEMLSFEGRNVPAEVIKVSGDKQAEFAWTRDNEIVLREFFTRGRRIAFVREASGVDPARAAQLPASRQ
jgi:hypothetical protein